MTACATVWNCAGGASAVCSRTEIAQGHEDDDMAIGHALQTFHQQLRRDRVDEIGEEDDQRAAAQPEIELGEA